MKPDDVQLALNSAEKICRNAGARLTEKRKNVLGVLLRAEIPLSAYEIVERYKVECGEPIPAMSVYRMLDFLTEQNLAHKLNSENKFVACAHIHCEHSHRTPQFLICGRCNKVQEIGVNPEVIAALRDTVKGAGFLLQTSQLELDCLCDECVQ